MTIRAKPLRCLFLLALAFACGAARADLPAAYKALELDQAFERAAKEGKKVLVVFTQIRCMPCRYVTGALARDDVRAAYLPNFVVAEVKLDEANGPAGFKRFGVRSTPTFVFFTPDRKRICQSNGFNNPTEGIVLAKTVLHAGKPADGGKITCNHLPAEQPDTVHDTTPAL